MVIPEFRVQKSCWASWTINPLSNEKSGPLLHRRMCRQVCFPSCWCISAQNEDVIKQRVETHHWVIWERAEFFYNERFWKAHMKISKGKQIALCFVTAIKSVKAHQDVFVSPNLLFLNVSSLLELQNFIITLWHFQRMNTSLWFVNTFETQKT